MLAINVLCMDCGTQENSSSRYMAGARLVVQSSLGAFEHTLYRRRVKSSNDMIMKSSASVVVFETEWLLLLLVGADYIFNIFKHC